MSDRRAGPTIGATLGSLIGLMTPAAFDVKRPDERAVPYRREKAGRGTAPRADIFLPEGPGPHPSIVVVHGGGFVVGNRKMKPIKFLGSKLTDAGWAVVAPSYRRVFRGGRLAEQVDDAVTAFRWWLDRARDDDDFDADRVVLAGISAGSTLSMLAAEQLDPTRIRHLVNIFGLYDFGDMGGALAKLIPPMLLRTGDPAEIAQRSPVNRPGSPIPMTFLHGTADQVAPYEQAERMLKARRATGLKADFIPYEGAPHAFLNNAKDPVCQQALADLLVILSRI